MINKSYLNIGVRICIYLQILVGYSIFNNSFAASSCGVPTYNRATQDGIYLWQICGSKEWFMRAVGGGRDSNNELRVEGNLVLSNPIQSITEFSIDPPDPNELFPVPDFVDASDRKNIKFRFRVWRDGQDGMDFKLPANTTTCLKILTPAGIPVFVGRSKTEITPPFNLLTLDGNGCAGIMSTLQILLLE